MTDQSKIRSFSIIAHINHGKSVLSDQPIEECNAVSQWEMESQLLNNMDLEREWGITIKARTVKLNCQAADRETYELNLIDTLGHVNFNYKVSRSLAAREGTVFIVDATQGIEARTLANTLLALEHNLEILPVVNKIGLLAADSQRVKDEIENVIGLPIQDASKISAKVGLNIDVVLEGIVRNVPTPKGGPKASFHALIFDSQYDAYRGVIVYFRAMEDIIKTGMRVKMMAPGVSYEVLEYDHLLPLRMESCGELIAGEVGCLTAPTKNVKDAQAGDTVTGVKCPAAKALPGYRPACAMVYCSVYTEDGFKYPDLRDTLEKLQLNDASLPLKLESSVALGFGFRYDFLGMLYMEIAQERLEREFDLDLIITPPSVIYRTTKIDSTVVTVDNPYNYSDPAVIELVKEPYVEASVVSPPDCVDNIMPMCQERQSGFKNMQYLDISLVELYYSMPLGEIVYDFFGTLKACTKGYASLDYELDKYKSSGLVRIDTLLNDDQVDTLSFIVHRERAYSRARWLCEKLWDNIPRQLSKVFAQATISGKVIARETVRTVRKDVLTKCYGGDITQRKKLLEKQKEGKKKMRSLDTVQIPTEVSMTVLKLDEE